MTPRSWLLPLCAFAVAFGARVAVVLLTPIPYAFDAFQRWAGRDHLLVRDWLPLTQTLVAAASAMGADHMQARLLAAAFASLGMAAGAILARRLAGESAGWLFVPLALFGPNLCWSAALYQEGTFLTVLLGGLALAVWARQEQRSFLAADLLIGLLGLVRYEGWPVVLLYILWRRDARAGLALWGALVWAGLRLSEVEGVRPSPVDYADWNGILSRFDLLSWFHELGRMASQAWYTGLLALTAAALLALVKIWRKPVVGLICAILGTQALVTLFWLAGVESAMTRMQVVPGVLLGLLVAMGFAPFARSRPRLFLALGVLVAIPYTIDGVIRARGASIGFEQEYSLLQTLRASPELRPVRLTPRADLGTRERHDGCEILLGLGELREGQDILCASWPAPTAPGAEIRAEPRAEAFWRRGEYHIREL